MSARDSDIAAMRLASEAVTDAFAAAHRDGGREMACAVARACLCSAAHVLLGSAGSEAAAAELRALAVEIESGVPVAAAEVHPEQGL